MDTLTSIDIMCLKEYANANMRLSEASRTLNYHYNSVLYHLKQVKKKTGLNPQIFWDLVKLLEVVDGKELS